jgi:5-amino-6-(5-phosphoribosylamino)uracil reductase
VLLSCATSVDGFIDDSSDARLVLSDEEDLDRVDEVRAGVDAILVGASTVRSDNPRLVVRSQQRSEARRARGLPGSPLKVTVTRSGDLDPDARFFTVGDVDKLVYCASGAVGGTATRLAGRATVIDAGTEPQPPRILSDLADRGVGRLMVEGGTSLHTQFLAAGVVDELQLVVTPIFVGDAKAPRFVDEGTLPAGRMTLAEVRQIGDAVLLRYTL